MPIPLPKPKRHIIAHRGTEIFIAIVLALTATYLIYDAFDWRGKKMPWPASGLFWG
jgi:hypothetical protein